ncbi:hypothetical protein AALF85_05285 [Jeotgalicoccus halotolerans]|uniref:hypothetical protein n=1 Tax=Jeotgalicoccus halotolerans TaxID=157227 RepID=UPI0035165581
MREKYGHPTINNDEDMKKHVAILDRLTQEMRESTKELEKVADKDSLEKYYLDIIEQQLSGLEDKNEFYRKSIAK